MEPKKPALKPSQTSRPVMDMLPKSRPPQAPVVTQASPTVDTDSASSSLDPQPITEEPVKKGNRWRRKIVIAIVLILTCAALVVGGVVGVNVWYQTQLQPVTQDKNAARIRVTIEPGSTPEAIAELLKTKGIIRDAIAFVYYTQDKGVQAKLQAGTFSLKPSDSLPVIVDHLVAGKTDEFSITFLPGETLAGHKKVLMSAGYDAAEVDAAFKKIYDHPVFASKPASADLEGYIFGETYSFTADATVEQVLIRTFDELYQHITQNDLVNLYQKQGLNLYQGIVLASVVQREVANLSESQQVAQVFYKRFRSGMPLGADATFVYAAKKVGATPSVDFDSPYNTRIHVGLPPGPIASPGLTALKAVAAPSGTDFLYFVSGDDGKTYFSKTLAEHEALTAQYCKKNCSLF